jgi:hypothetical protein
MESRQSIGAGLFQSAQVAPIEVREPSGAPEARLGSRIYANDFYAETLLEVQCSNITETSKE